MLKVNVCLNYYTGILPLTIFDVSLIISCKLHLIIFVLKKKL